MPLTLRVAGVHGPVAGVQVSRQNGSTWDRLAATDEEGVARLSLDPTTLPLLLLFEARSGYWPKVIRAAVTNGEAEIRLVPLPRAGPRGWWHTVLGGVAGARWAGRGIRVGILDTGAGPHPCLTHVESAGAWVRGNVLRDREAGRDVAQHGTQVAGLVAGREEQPGDYVGVAPAVTAIVGRVFSPREGAGHDDVANAIEALVDEHAVHLLNLSLGGLSPAETERDAVAYAFDQGVVMIAAAGNDRGPIHYPAAYDEVVAVGALGKSGEGSELARAGIYVAPDEPAEPESGLYLAEFSCHGPELGCAAPGVEIISPVPCPGPDGEFTSFTGTSAAGPIACATLAILLAEDPAYAEMEPDRARAEYALRLLRRSCRDLGFSPERQGAGLPTLA